jgi:hypothetical protein
MCKLELIYTADELKALDKKTREILQENGVHLVRTAPAIREIIKKDPKINKKLKELLSPTLKRLTK